MHSRCSSHSGESHRWNDHTGGTATGGGTDYTLANGTFTITAGLTSDTLKIEIIDDSDIETDETIEITLSNPTIVSLGSNTVHLVTINDNDFAGFTGPAGVGDTSNNKLWLRADDITGLSDSDPVSSWPDTSGKNNDANQSTSSAKPTYRINSINELPAVRFDDTDDYFENVVEITSQNITIIAVTFWYNGKETVKKINNKKTKGNTTVDKNKREK